jgi:hypothetical protein
VLLTWTWFRGEQSVPVLLLFPEEDETIDTNRDDNNKGGRKGNKLSKAPPGRRGGPSGQGRPKLKVRKVDKIVD